jgi:hypothetical protein
MNVIRVFVFCAWTNAPSTGAPSGLFTVPVIVAPKQSGPRKTTRLNNATSLHCDRIGLPFQSIFGSQILVPDRIMRPNLTRLQAEVIKAAAKPGMLEGHCLTRFVV